MPLCNVRFIRECLEAKTMHRRLRDWAAYLVDKAFHDLSSTHSEWLYWVLNIFNIDNLA
jgi:hypothetical protein